VEIVLVKMVARVLESKTSFAEEGAGIVAVAVYA
jgi:hypothetical protein